MNKRCVIFGVLFLLFLSALLCACGKDPGSTPGGSTKKQYIVGKNPKTEEITGLRIAYGSSQQDQAWSYFLSRSSGNVFHLTYAHWDETRTAAT